MAAKEAMLGPLLQEAPIVLLSEEGGTRSQQQEQLVLTTLLMMNRGSSCGCREVKKLRVEVTTEAMYLPKFHICRWPMNLPLACLAWLKHCTIRSRRGTSATTQAMMMPSTESDLRQLFTSSTVKSEVQKQRVQAKSLMGTTKETSWSVAQLRRKVMRTKGERAIFLSSRQKYFLPRGLKTYRLGKKIQRKYTVHTTKGAYSIGSLVPSLLLFTSSPKRQQNNITQKTKVKNPARFMIWKCVEQWSPYSRMFLKFILQEAKPQAFQAMPQRQRISSPTPRNMGKMQFMESIDWSSQARDRKLRTSRTTREMKVSEPRPIQSPRRKQFLGEVNLVVNLVNFFSLPYYSVLRQTMEEWRPFEAFQIRSKQYSSDSLSRVDSRSDTPYFYQLTALTPSRSSNFPSTLTPEDPESRLILSPTTSSSPWYSTSMNGLPQTLTASSTHSSIFLLSLMNSCRQSIFPQIILISSLISDLFSQISCSIPSDDSFSVTISNNYYQRQTISLVLYRTKACTFRRPERARVETKRRESWKFWRVRASRGRICMWAWWKRKNQW